MKVSTTWQQVAWLRATVEQLFSIYFTGDVQILMLESSGGDRVDATVPSSDKHSAASAAAFPEL